MIRRSQSLLEYSILMVIIIAALLTLQTYIKRGIQGRLKSSTDDIGDQYSQEQEAGYYKRVNTYSLTKESSRFGTTTTQQCATGYTNTYSRINTNAVERNWYGTTTTAATQQTVPEVE